jgi:cytochrome c-type biogenesis protein CcmH
MTAPAPSARRLSPATIALIAAALIATFALGMAFKSWLEGPPADVAVANSSDTADGGNMVQVIAGLREALRREPDNDQGWFRLGLALRETEQFGAATQAFRRAMELAPRNPDYHAYLGETLLLMSGNAPPPEASAEFRRAIELQPGNPQARYYLATLKDHGGDHRGALDDLIALLREAPAGASWAPQVRQAAVEIAGRAHIDIAGRLPPAPETASATAAIPGPTPEQMQSASAIPPSQQDQMVRSMVARLAARLQQNPHDESGWVQLMRSRMVLHDQAAARGALRAALAAFATDAAAQARLRDAAGQLGVPAG